MLNKSRRNNKSLKTKNNKSPHGSSLTTCQIGRLNNNWKMPNRWCYKDCNSLSHLTSPTGSKPLRHLLSNNMTYRRKLLLPCQVFILHSGLSRKLLRSHKVVLLIQMEGLQMYLSPLLRRQKRILRTSRIRSMIIFLIILQKLQMTKLIIKLPVSNCSR